MATLNKPQPVDIVHSFDTWRQITNLILRDLGNIDDIENDLRDFSNIVDAVSFVYASTQSRLRTTFIKSLGMS